MREVSESVSDVIDGAFLDFVVSVVVALVMVLA